MQFQVAQVAGDYIVEAYVQLTQEEGWAHWRPVINFGDRQGDAIAFRDRDAHDLKPERLLAMIRAYDGTRKERIRNGQYKKQRQ